MTTPKPSPTAHPGYFQRYIALVQETDLTEAFRNQRTALEKLLASINEEKSNYAYAEGKWTLKEVLQHIIDAERIFNYRALCFARGEKQNLPGFEENDYALNSFAGNRKWDELVKEFWAVRQSTEYLFGSFNSTVLENVGTANSNTNTVSGIGFLTIGHCLHHQAIIKERYL